MKKVVAGLLLTLAAASSAFAGIGGYVTTTCVSESGRTVVTLAEGDDLEQIVMTLVMDGQSAVYSLKDQSVKFSGNDDVIIASKNNSIEVSLERKNKNRTLTVQVDPRKGTLADQNSKSDVQDIKVVCKKFEQQP